MEYELKHKENLVLILELNEDYRIEEINEVIDEEKIPVGLKVENYIKKKDIDNWIMNRGIPAKREGIEYILDKENVENVRELLIKNNALGLTDHYWIAEKDSDLKWKDINYFENENGFEKLGDNIYLGIKEDSIEQGRTPSSSASGMQPKRWVLYGKERWLIKSSEETTKQEAFSELAASKILEKINIDHVNYEIINKYDEILSGCINMLEKNEELIPAWYVDKGKKSNNESNLEHYIKRCRELGVESDIKIELDKMIVFDYIAANTDRHWNNFAVIRDADNLKAKRIAPLYDHGAAFYTKFHHLDMSKKNIDLECKSFRTKQEENIKLVKNIDWLEIGLLSEIPDIVNEIMKKNKYGSLERTNVIVSCINERIKMFKKNMKMI